MSVRMGQLPQWLGVFSIFMIISGKSPSNMHGSGNPGCPGVERYYFEGLSVILSSVGIIATAPRLIQWITEGGGYAVTASNRFQSTFFWWGE